jgi:hypothetical protein
MAGIAGSNRAEGMGVSRLCLLFVVEVTGRSLVQRSPTGCGVCLIECDLETSTMRWPRPE